MNGARLKVKNWSEFQHYKGRQPPWIKLHRSTLDDFGFHRLPVASRALAPMIWLLASESDDGSVAYDLEEIAFRLRGKQSEIADAIKPLIDNGFLILVQDASASLADRKQSAMPEVEEEEDKRKNIYSPGFENSFWQPIPAYRKQSKRQAWKAYQMAEKRGLPENSGELYAAHCQAKGDFAQYPATWLNADGWLDAMPPVVGIPTTTFAAERAAIEAWLKPSRIPGGAWFGHGPPPDDPGSTLPAALKVEYADRIRERSEQLKHGVAA